MRIQDRLSPPRKFGLIGLPADELDLVVPKGDGHTETRWRARRRRAAAPRSLLPLTLTLTDYAETEKVADLPRRLSTADAPAGVDPDVGDIAYYAPWKNLAIFYRDAVYATGLVKLGSIDSGIRELAGMSEDFTITIEAAG